MTEADKQIEQLQALKEIAEWLNNATDLQDMLENALKKLLAVTNLETGWIFFINQDGGYELVADVALPPALCYAGKRPMCEGPCWCIDRFVDGRLQKATNIIECKRIEDAIEHHWGNTRDITHHATIPLRVGEERFGLLNVASPNKTHFTEEELALLEAIAYQIGATIKRIKLVERERQFVVVAERNRLARDLHDSVKQLLFSIMLTARGVRDMTEDTELQNMLSYIGELSQEALQEMRTLIWQLRPEGLEKGVVEALKGYGEMLGLTVQVNVQGILCLSSTVEETLWRIGQEAMNNCKKHTDCEEISLYLAIDNDKKKIIMNITDDGAGFCMQDEKSSSLGLKSMKERATLAGGTCRIESVKERGTTIIVKLPI
ncbi:GAF domain-containing sensor histidine kinase [Microbacteriaceae bacterium 4G12]